MTGLRQRGWNFLIEEDEALNVAGGGKLGETISGTTGRACGFAGSRIHWWGQPLRVVIDAIFGKDHCRRKAESEQRVRDALSVLYQ